MIDLLPLSDEQLVQLATDVMTERERRQRLEQVPGQVADLVRRYTEDGGNPAVIVAAINDA